MERTSKFDLAKKILSNTTDSVSRTNQKVEFALRVFGHQSPRAANNCKDTKLEVSFSKGNAAAIDLRLKQLQPQGQTPIEFSLTESLMISRKIHWRSMPSF
jgi:Ca-activated chloride channel family protein